MAAAALADFSAAVDAARPETAPPLIALHQVTANVLQVKTRWRFAIHGIPVTPESAEIQQEIAQRALNMLGRAQKEGIIDAEADLEWLRQVYYALVQQSVQGGWCDIDMHVDTLASRIVATLLYGAAPPPS
jgi:hypothetical protein